MAKSRTAKIDLLQRREYWSMLSNPGEQILPGSQLSGGFMLPTISSKGLYTAIHHCCMWLISNHWDYFEKLCRKHWKKLKLPAEESVVIGERDIWRLCLGSALADYLFEERNPEQIREVTLGFTPQNFVTEAYHTFADKTQSDIDLIAQAAISRQKASQDSGKYPLYFAFLHLWTYGIESYYIDKYFKSYVFMREEIECRKNWVESEFHMEKSFDESSRVKVFVRRLKSRLLDYVGETDEGENALESYIIDSLSLPSKDISSNHGKAMSRYIRMLLIYNNVTLIALDDMKMLDRIKNAVDDVCKMFILSCYEKAYMEVMNSETAPSLLSSVPVSPRAGLEEGDIGRYVNSADIAPLFTSCVWASAIYTVLGSIRETTERYAFSYCENAALNDQISVSENIRLKQQVEQMKKEIAECPKEKYQSLAEENIRLKKENKSLTKRISSMEEAAASQSMPVQNRLREAEAKTRMMQKKMEEMGKKLEQAQVDAEALREKTRELEKINATASSLSDNVATSEVDTTKKYLFILNDAKMRRKIKVWFPNSEISEKVELTSKSSSSYYMAIFITKSISHVEYFRFKQKCLAYGIPINYCNQLNYRLVCQSIIKCKQEYNLAD